MSELEKIYIHILRVGFVVLRQAIDSGDSEWLSAEIEMLHNIPSLIGEENPERHRYYWMVERPHHVAWAESHKPDEARKRIRTYYEPIWDELKKQQLGLFG